LARDVIGGDARHLSGYRDQPVKRPAVEQMPTETLGESSTDNPLTRA